MRYGMIEEGVGVSERAARFLVAYSPLSHQFLIVVRGATGFKRAPRD